MSFKVFNHLKKKKIINQLNQRGNELFIYNLSRIGVDRQIYFDTQLFNCTMSESMKNLFENETIEERGVC